MSIILSGIPTESPIALAASSAARLGLQAIVLNQRALTHDSIELTASSRACAGTLLCGRQQHDVATVTGIYSRNMAPTDLPECAATGRAAPSPLVQERATAWADIMNAWAECAPLRVANRPTTSMSNFSKPYQCQIIRRSGLQTPATLITNDPDEVRAFHTRHRKVIFKSISGVRSIVRLLDEANLKNLSRVSLLPTQFQAFVPGDNVRVHVVGRHCFAARIVSDAVDYRYATHDGLDVDMQTMTLPDDVASACVALAQALRLAFCGIDFKLTPDGSFVCFEVNTSPAYSYYEENTGLPISDALVRYLAGQD